MPRRRRARDGANAALARAQRFHPYQDHQNLVNNEPQRRVRQQGKFSNFNLYLIFYIPILMLKIVILNYLFFSYRRACMVGISDSYCTISTSSWSTPFAGTPKRARRDYSSP